jgi:hypothetical protein
VHRLIPFILIGFIWFGVGCSSLPKKPASVPYHQLYVPIEDAEAHRFIEAGLHLLMHEHGPLEFTVNEVLLRQSKRNTEGCCYAIAEAFSLTEIVDAQAGVFTIYIAVPPGHPEFYLLLAHEIGHLQQPSRTDDWEMEGFCMVFSEDFCRQQGKDWRVWEQRFCQESKDPYARAYHSALQLR